MKRLAILTTHPIQYHSPLFSEIARQQKIIIKVFYTWGDNGMEEKFDPGFGKKIKWDIPLLEGYDYTFVENTAKHKGSHHFKGIKNPSLINELLNWRADAILVFGWSYQSHLRILKYFKGKIPVLFRGDSTLIDVKRSFRQIARFFFLKYIYSFIDTVFYVGTNNKMYFRKYGLKENQMVFAPHIIDNKRFGSEDLQDKRNRWRNKLSISDNDIVFLFAGKLEPKKDPEILIKAFSQIQEKNVHVVLVGNGELEQSLKNSYSHLINLHFIDFQNQSEMPGVYKMSDVFVLPSKGPFETWGLTVNEAMASGKAVIVSDKTGCSIDLVQEGENGYIFKAQNCTDLLNKMRFFVSDPNKIIAMGKKSKQIIAKLDIPQVATIISNHVNQVNNV